MTMQYPALGTTIAYANMTSTMSTVSGVDCVADDIMNRIQTSSLFYDADYGYDVFGLVNASTNSASAVSSRVEAEIKKDDRVSFVTVQSSFVAGTLSMTIQVLCSNGQTFTLVGSLSSIPTFQLTFTRA